MVANFRSGLILVATAILFWGSLPIAMKVLLPVIDPVTLTWFRFICAFAVTVTIQITFKRLGDFKLLRPKHWAILTVAMLGSITNYVLFIVSLNYLSGPTAQLLFQVAPLMMALGGVLFFREKLSPVQILYFAGVVLGMLMFFNKELGGSSGNTQMLIGILCVFFSAISWVIYTLLQKSLLGRISSSNILLFIYFSATLLLLPFSSPEKILVIKAELVPVLLFLSLNTLIAYEAFTRSLTRWPISRIGAAITLVPVVAFGMTYIFQPLWPENIKIDQLNLLAFIGVGIVIVCSIGASLAGYKKA